MSPLLTDRTWCELDIAAWELNLKVASANIGGQLNRVICVIKANAYGHGIHLLPLALIEKAHGAAVATAEEAAQLRTLGFRGRIYLLSPALPAEYPTILQTQCIPLISTLAELDAFGEMAALTQTPLRINLELDTGMGRSGVLPEFDEAICAKFQEFLFLKLDSLSSHFSSSDENEQTTQEQDRRFLARADAFRQAGMEPEYLHLANSAGSLAFPQPAPRLVRCGLMLYGASLLPEFQDRLRPCLTWKARVILVRELPAGWPVSYGGTFICQQTTRVATIGVGYADGYPRAVSGKDGFVLIHGIRCPLLGRVTMDQIMVDVTHLPVASVNPGTEAVLLGVSGGDAVPASLLAEKAGTIPYEIFTSIGPRVKRRSMTGGLSL